MKNELNQHIKQDQRIALTPELQQSIQLLQYNFIELKDYLNDKILENPFLEIENYDYFLEQSVSFNHDDSNSQQWIEQLPDNRNSSLKSHLYDQIITNYKRNPLRDLMIELLDEIDHDGYFDDSSDRITKFKNIDHHLFLEALTSIQQLDPPGVGARTLQECLIIQVLQDHTAPPMTYEVLKDCFNEFAEQDWKSISQQLSIDEVNLQLIIAYIQQLTPRPGLAYGDNNVEYLYPELTIQSVDTQLSYELNSTMMPRISFNHKKIKLFQQSNDEDLKEYLTAMEHEYQWLKSSLTRREETLSKLAEAIIHFQSSYILKESSFPIGLTMRTVAQWMDVHESTVSRLVKNKYINLQGKTIPIRSLFPTPINENNETTKEMIQNSLLKLIKNEPKGQPYSDQELSDQLSEQGISVARRTISKYRKELNIPSSTQRKQ